MLLYCWFACLLRRRLAANLSYLVGRQGEDAGQVVVVSAVSAGKPNVSDESDERYHSRTSMKGSEEMLWGRWRIT